MCSTFRDLATNNDGNWWQQYVFPSQIDSKDLGVDVDHNGSIGAYIMIVYLRITTNHYTGHLLLQPDANSSYCLLNLGTTPIGILCDTLCVVVAGTRLDYAEDCRTPWYMGTIGACVWTSYLQNIRRQTLLENPLLYIGLANLARTYTYCHPNHWHKINSRYHRSL